MMLIENKTYTYWVGGNFLVDIVDTPEAYEAYVYNTEYGVKEMMLGCSKEYTTLEDFIKEVEANDILIPSIESYKEEYMYPEPLPPIEPDDYQEW